jgi:phage terminase small subunit
MALSAKQKAFINAYFVTFNATEAARQAKYKGDDATLASVGWENLRKPEIAKAIEERLSEQAMPAGEVLMRLADQARGSIGDFVKLNEKGDPAVSFQPDKLHLIKKLKTKTRTYTDMTLGSEEDEPIQVTETTVEFELYDAQAALALIGKHHKLFTEKVEMEHSGSVDITADERAQADKEIEAWRNQRKNDAETSSG